MRNVVKPNIEFLYEEAPEDKKLVQAMYKNLLEIAKKNILTGNLIKLTSHVTVSARARIINERH